MVASPAGIFNGVPLPKILPGKMITPPHLSVFYTTSATLLAVTLTAARYYITPFYVSVGQSFAGVKFYNTGAGDNGKKVKIAFYSPAVAGGPGALAKDFSEVTLTGAAAIRTLASAWSPSPGWYYGALTSDTTPVLAAMGGVNAVTQVGYVSQNYIGGQFGKFPTALFGTSGVNSSEFLGDIVAGTYANFPEATSLTPTASLLGDGGMFPAFGLYA